MMKTLSIARLRIDGWTQSGDSMILFVPSARDVAVLVLNHQHEPKGRSREELSLFEKLS